LAKALGGEFEGDPKLRLKAAAGLEDAAPGTIVRVEHPRYLPSAISGAASALLVDAALNVEGKACVRVPHVRLAFARCLELFTPEDAVDPGIHPSAVVDESAEVSEQAYIGPLVVVGRRSRIAAGAVIHAHTVIGDDCSVGPDSVLFANVVLYQGTTVGARVRLHGGVVLGADGFGYVWDGSRHRKIPQVGRIRIEDDVEIGANSCVDRGTTTETVIGAGTKIDNLVQIGHNVRTGPHCLIISHVGIGGSATLGTGVVVAGEAGIKDHATVGDGAVVGAQAGVWGDVPPGGRVSGNPARDHREEMRIQGSLGKLPQLLKRVRELERRLGIEPGIDPKTE
jgi:UDP-3-O-[3-hydroxymyristoyl] glucosamine N-acyltransferase